MGDEQPDEPAAAALIDDAVRGQLAAQMERLNDNLEKQFLLIEDQRQADERQRAKDNMKLWMKRLAAFNDFLLFLKESY